MSYSGSEMLRKNRVCRIRLAVVAVCLVALLPFVASGQLSETVQRGVDWLKARVAESGLLSNADSIANLQQQRSEVAQTLRLLATIPDELKQAVAIAKDVVGDLDTETLSRQLLARDVSDSSALPLLSELLTRQVSDGGFAGAQGYGSHVVDTAWAITALVQHGRGAGTEAVRARANLAGRIGETGIDESAANAVSLLGSARVINAALASIALQSGGDSSSITGVQKISRYLRSAQGPDGGWQSDTLASAWALLALGPVSSDEAYRTLAQEFLHARQKADGSWNSDPYITAIALRSLSVTPGAAATSSVSAEIVGGVQDAASGQVLEGVSVTLVQASTGISPVVLPTDASGKFKFSNLPAGAYQVSFSRAGYQPFATTLNLFSAQKYDLGPIKLSASSATGILKGIVVAQATGVPLSGVAVTVTGASAQSATTDSSGRFEFSALNPGSINISASRSGYATVTGVANVAAGQTLIFSPLLYVSGSDVPVTGRFSGQIVSATTEGPLDAATIALSGASSEAWASSGGGFFGGNLAPGFYVATYSKSGYGSVQQRFVVAAGSNVSAGAIRLKPMLTVSSLKGRVLSDVGGVVAGAQVEIIGSQPLIFSKSTSDGSYDISGLAGLRLDVRVSAAGYTSQAVTLQLDQASDVQRDFVLAVQKSGKLQLGALVLDKGSVLAGANISGTVVVSNSDTSPAVLSGLMLVQDQEGRSVANGALLNASGEPVGDFALAAGESRTLHTNWNSAQFEPGMYQYLVRFVEPGSRTQALPLGVTLGERGALFVISEDKRIAGAVVVNPPVVRAGVGSVVRLNARLQNAGNTDLVSQDYRVRIVNATTNAVAYESAIQGASLRVAALSNLDFGNWTAATAGNYQVRVTAVAEDVAGVVANLLYVGDSGSAIFSVSPSVVPTGNRSVKAKVAVAGQDVTTGAIGDPLAPLIKTAVQKAVTFNDTSAQAWTASNNCIGCHIQTQALVGGEINRKITTHDAVARATILNNTTLNQVPDGTISRTWWSGPRTTTMLGAWALSSYHDKSAIASTIKRAFDWTVASQSSDGRWYPDWCDSRVWWCTNEAFTAVNLRSTIEAYKLLLTVNPEKVKGYSLSDPGALNAIGNSRAVVANDSAGNSYFAYTNGKVVQRTPSGALGAVWSGLNDPRGLAEFQGAMVVSTASGLFKLLPDGTLLLLSSFPSLDYLAASPDGAYLYSNDYWGNRIYRVQSDYSTEVWASGVGLDGPARLTVDEQGAVYVPNWRSGYGFILRIAPDKTVRKVVGTLYGASSAVLRTADGWLVAGSNGIYRFNNEWEGELAVFGNFEGDLRRLPDGKLVFARYNGPIMLLDASTPDLSVSTSSYLVAIDRATSYLFSRDTLSSMDVFQLAHHLAGLGEASKFYLTTDPTRAASMAGKMAQIAARLRANVNADGGWGRYLGQASDTMATAQVGLALDYTNPSPSDPLIRKAVEWLLSKQTASGSWHSAIAGTDLAATTWVSIWLPVMLDRLGGIDTDLSVSIPATSTASAFNPVPTTTASQADGSTLYKWSMTGVTATGRNVEFDLALSNLLPNEQRPAAGSAFLTFKNSFNSELVDSPIDIPKIKATAQLDLSAATDKSVYGSDSPVLISSAVVNGATLATSASVQFQIFAPDGKLVSDLGVFPTGSIGAGANANTNAVWNTGSSLLASGYSVLVTLFDVNGNPVTQLNLPFDIGATGQQVSARVSTDRASYSPRDTVYITDRVSNLIPNSVREGLSLRTVVLRPDGQIQWQITEPVAQLLGGVSKELAYGVNFSGAASGSYTVTLTVLDSLGTSVAAASTRFSVRDTAQDGAGLSGSVSASPKSINAGETLSLAYTLSNQGNANLNGLPLSVRIVDPQASASQALISEITLSASVSAGGSTAGSVSWLSATSLADRNLVAVFVVRLAGKEIVLGQDSFKLVQPAVKVDVTPALGAEARVLALVSCPTSASGGSTDPGYDSNSTPDTTVRADIASCVARRIKALDDYLTSLGVAHKIVTTREEFATEFHCGIYNTYWINGGLQKLDNTLAKEIREAVERGDGLIADSLRNASRAGPQTLPAILGIQQGGKLAQNGTDMQFVSGSSLGSGQWDAAGQGTIVTRTTAASLANFVGQSGEAPAITRNSFGQGKALLFAFDLVDMMAATPLPSPSAPADQALRNLVAQSLVLVTPVGTSPRANRPATGVIHLVNSGALVAKVTARLTLPAGFKLEDAQPQVASAPQLLADGRTQLNWSAMLNPGATQDIIARLRVGGTAGHFDLPLEITLTPVDANGNAGSAMPVVSYTLPLDVLAAATVASTAQPAANALVVSGVADTGARGRALDLLSQANTLLTQSNYPDALDRLVRAADEVRSVTSADTAAARLAIAQTLEAAATPLCKMLGCITGSVSFSAREIALGNNIVMGRTVYNNCQPQIKDIPVTALLTRQRTGATELTLWDNLTISGYQNNLRQAGWQAQGQEGDQLTLNLSAVWMSHYLQLDRQSFKIIVPPPALTGTLTLPGTPKVNTNLSIGWKVVNSGALGKDIPVSLRLTNVTKGNVITSYDQSLTLNPGQTSSGNYNWFSATSAGVAGDQIKLELIATVKGVAQTLATGAMVLKP